MSTAFWSQDDMERAIIFLSSTFADLSATRMTIAGKLRVAGHHVVLAEDGDLSYDPSAPPEQSCYEKVLNSHLFILIIGRRYGSPTCASLSNKEYKSITLREYETARDAGLAIYTFVHTDLKPDFEAYSRHKVRKGKFPSVDDPQVLELIKNIQTQPRNNIIKWYSSIDEITDFSLHQLSGLLRRSIDSLKGARSKVRINCFKLFFHRTWLQKLRTIPLDLEQLAQLSGLSASMLKRLEQRKTVSDNFYDLENFPWCELADIEKLERALECPGDLRAGQPDDFVTEYLIHYRHYRRHKRKGRPINSRGLPTQIELPFDTRAVIFDFDGTLTVEHDRGTVWQRLWEEAGLSRDECSFHHERYRRGEINHSEWCDITCKRFREQVVTRETILRVAHDIKLVESIQNTIAEMKSRNIHTSILSGSIKEVIQIALGDNYRWIDDVQANEIEFDDNGLIRKIHGTPYDYKTKPDYIRQVVKRRRLDPLQVLFVGNSANDAWASRSGARTVCVNPIETDPGNSRNWTSSIRHMTSLSQILRHVA